MVEGLTKAERVRLRRLLDRQEALARLRDTEQVRLLIAAEVERIRAAAGRRQPVGA